MSFRIRLTIAMILSMLLIVVSSNIVIQRFLLNAQLEELRDKLKIVAQTAAVGVDPVVLKAIPLNKEGRNSPAYKSTADLLLRVRDNNQKIQYIYILTKTDKEGLWQFMVDIEPKNVKDKRAASPGDKYNAARFSKMLKAWDEACADKNIEVDEWGPSLSGYAPIRGADGKTIAVLGVDISASDYYATRHTVNVRSLLVFFIGVLLSLVVGVLMSIYITAPINALVEGTKRVSLGDLQHKVVVKRKDEIGQLATSFNKMAGDLDSAREQNSNYFYGVIKALVRTVEAKDKYTRGHSERVAEYAVGIAAKMGFLGRDIDLIRQTAILHDIGKIGIQDDILNKSGALTDEERATINHHPQIGEEIILPVAASPQMAAIIRGHHERYDGTGYPDHLKADNINIFSQIISVADAYDAMTSTRAYRKARSRDAALVEIKKGHGTQFDPKVVDAFLALVDDEVRVIRT